MAKHSEAKVQFKIEHEQFKKGMKELTNENTKLRKEFQLQQQQMKLTASEVEKLEAKVQFLSKQKEIVQKKIELTNEHLERARKVYGDNSEEVDKLTKELLDLQVQEQRIENSIQTANNQISKQREEMEKAESKAKKFGESIKKAGENVEEFGEKADRLGGKLTTRVTAPILAGGTAIIKAASDFESAFAGVIKTVDATDAQLEQIRQGIRDMAKELPASATEIAGVAEAAGQLGIETENILEFTRTMIDLGEATNMTSEQAATDLARLANITQMPKENFDRLGSSIVALGNNFATTEREITSMALRLAAQGKQIGMTEAQILALAATMSSLGIEAEAGGTAMTTVLKRIQTAVGEGGESLKGFADVARVSSKEFAEAFRKDPVKALDLFVKGLSQSSEEGKNLTTILANLGIKGIRESDTLLRMAGAADLLTEAVETSSKAWEENTALTKEAEQRYSTTESKVKILWNRIKDIGIELGEVLVPAFLDVLDASEPLIRQIEKGAKAFTELSKEEQQTILKMVGLAAATGPALKGVGALTTGVGGLMKGLGSVTETLGNESKGLLPRIAALGKGGVVGLAIAGIGLLAAGIYNLTKEKERLRDVSLDTYNAMMDEYRSNEKLIEQLDELRNKSKLTNDEFARYVDLHSELAEATNPGVIEAINREMHDLQTKSGLSNDELEEMVRLNGELVEALPGATEKITEQGNKIAGTTVELQKYNQEINQMATLELLGEYYDALENQEILLKELTKEQEKLNSMKEREQELALILKDTSDEGLKAAKEKVELEIAYLTELRRTTYLTEEEFNLIGDQIDGRLELLKLIDKGKEALSEEHLELKKNLVEQEKLVLEKEEEIKKLDTVIDRLVEQYLTSAGITAEKARQAIHDNNAIEVLDEKIKLLEEEKRKIYETTPIAEQNTELFQEQVKSLDDQIDRLETAKSNIQGLVKDASNYNEELGKDIEKKIGLKYDPDPDSLDKRLSRPVTKPVHINGVPKGPYLAPMYAKGTDFHPGGPAILAEEGPELVRQGNNWAIAPVMGVYNLKRGADVFTAEQTKKILNGLARLPAYADGVGAGRKINNISNNIGAALATTVQNQIVVNVEASGIYLDGRKVGEVIWRPVKEHIEFDGSRNKLFRG